VGDDGDDGDVEDGGRSQWHHDDDDDVDVDVDVDDEGGRGDMKAA
jgi:hypothetical protein